MLVEWLFQEGLCCEEKKFVRIVSQGEEDGVEDARVN